MWEYMIYLAIAYYIIVAVMAFFGGFDWMKLGRLTVIGSLLMPFMLPFMLMIVGYLKWRERPYKAPASEELCPHGLDWDHCPDCCH